MQTRSSVPPSSLLIPQVANGWPNGPKHPAASLSKGRETDPSQHRTGKATQLLPTPLLAHRPQSSPREYTLTRMNLFVLYLRRYQQSLASQFLLS